MAKHRKPNRKNEGKSNETDNTEKGVKKARPRFWDKFSVKRDILGKVWFRLDYYDKRLMKLDDEKQKTFLDNYMESTRQLNKSIITIVIFMIIIYIIYSFNIFSMAETAIAWIILLYLLFYMARHHRKENEELLRHLLDTEITPAYAKYTRKK
jgi:hypothetical protein